MSVLECLNRMAATGIQRASEYSTPEFWDLNTEPIFRSNLEYSVNLLVCPKELKTTQLFLQCLLLLTRFRFIQLD